MTFDINECKQKFIDLSGEPRYCYITNDGTNEIIKICMTNLSGEKADYDKILNEDILPIFPYIRNYGFEKDKVRGDFYTITCSKNDE